jgi:hypothetical protein
VIEALRTNRPAEHLVTPHLIWRTVKTKVQLLVRIEFKRPQYSARDAVGGHASCVAKLLMVRFRTVLLEPPKTRTQRLAPVDLIVSVHILQVRQKILCVKCGKDGLERGANGFKKHLLHQRIAVFIGRHLAIQAVSWPGSCQLAFKRASSWASVSSGLLGASTLLGSGSAQLGPTAAGWSSQLSVILR